MKNRKQANRGFTLTELLAVIAIMGVMIVALVPAFSEFGAATKIESAVVPLRATLNQARQYAISNNHSVHVVFPHLPSAGGSPIDVDTLFPNQNDKQKILRSYAVYSPRDGLISEWKFLPVGVIFDPSYELGRNALVRTDSQSKIRFPNYKTSDLVDMQCITYRPDGSVKNRTRTSADPAIYVVRGTTDADEDPVTSSLSYNILPSSDGQVLRLGLLVRTLTGSTRELENLQ